MTWVVVVSVVSFALALVAVPWLFYLGALTLLSAKTKAPLTSETPGFVFVVPAHNEAQQIATTVSSLLAVDYPKASFKVLVVADNCQDDTARIAEALGADVFERQHETLRGKGYALEAGFAQALEDKACDAVVVVDADSTVSGNFLRALAARLHYGAWAIQANYGVSNPYASWRTRLMAVALGMFHRVRSLGRERLKVSCGLRGNGMCFSRACLSRFNVHAYGLTEDVEYGLALGRGGVRVVYADEAHVLGEMVSNASASASQRQRWETGRKQLLRQQLPQLSALAVKRRSGLLFDLAMDLWVPPLSTVVMWLVFGLSVEAARLCLTHTWALTSSLWCLGTACLAGYVLRGAALSGLGLGAVTTLLWAPAYVAWKVVLKVSGRGGNTAWVRTTREAEHRPNDSSKVP